MLKDEVRTLTYRNAVYHNRHLFRDKVVQIHLLSIRLASTSYFPGSLGCGKWYWYSLYVRGQGRCEEGHWGELLR